MEEMCPSVPPVEITDDVTAAPPVEEVKASIVQEVGSLVAWVSTCQSLTFFAFEAQLVQVLALGCLFIQLFLCMRKEQFQETHPQPQPGYKRISPISRSLGTFFGKVRYWRTYFYREWWNYPLDVALGLTRDGFSMLLRSHATRIATKVSYAQATLLLGLFLHWSPAQESIEAMVLGLGQHTTAWFVPSQKVIDGTSLFSKPNILPQPRRSKWSPPKY